MFFGIYMITVADPQILWNDGFYPLVDVVIPDELVLEAEVPRGPQRPQPRHRPGIRPVRRPARSDQPRLLNAAGFSSSPHFMYSGTYGEGDRKGEWFQLYSIGFGGIPGRPIGDGPDGHSLWPSFVNIPCEYLESYYPLRIEKWETIADTGGAGLHRGGNGVDVAYRFLEAGTIVDPRRPLADLPLGRQRRRARRARPQVARARRRHHRGAGQQGARRPGRAAATCCTS